MSLYGPTQSGGGSLVWYNDAFDLNWDFKISQNIENIIFLPYLEGERAPIWDPDAKGVFVGIKTKHNQSNFARAVLEGVAFSVRHVLENAMDVTGIEPDRIRLTGGGSRNRVWNQIRADVLGITVETLVVDDSSTLGAAMLAALGTEYYDNMSEVSLKMAKIKEKFKPRDEYKKKYNHLYSLYKEVYKNLSSLFPKF
jgi:xylulokinase